jgi:CDP-4-dehydro-6-deoxyglucose reductase
VLQPEELDTGFTLLCQAQPRSDMVIESREVRLASDIQIRKLPARVTQIRQAAPDVAILTLQLPSSETFRYYAGQYVELILKEGKRRAYSMANPPDQTASIELHVRHMPGGLFTDHVFGAGATAMKEREILRFEGPFGSFFLQEDSAKPIVFLASGTGFAPIKAIIESMIEKNVQRPAVLYWGGRRPQDLYLHELAQSWASVLPGFRYIPVVSDALAQDAWQGRTGFVHQAVMTDFPDLTDYEVYACGAPIVVESARRDFQQVCGLPDDAFFADAFTSAADGPTT